MASSAQLLRLAAEALDQGINPLANPFLGDNEVTYDQCVELAESLAIGARIMARAIEHPESLEAVAMFAAIAGGPG